ncbi:major intrinsically disordered NOTCH2-binding receptor 1-like [Triplophysa dalaica]|uniref:major intrinsically disordered NOTCH2-binding receptor 1-like n=1 Tax=Triplophysa dalaica TaxID=1582913 RepID=UPI0024DF62C4|nr:major intrinsically disordered NOTCH2-binding receptor 1-like [Triplophysa dalaica]
MDITVLPNNNHPEKFLQLDVGMLPVTHGMFQIGAALSRQRQWHNRMYSQVNHVSYHDRTWHPSADGGGVFRDRELEKHITPQTLKPNIKQNPLYAHISIINNTEENNKSKPSWTIKEYDRHTAHGQLGDYMKEDPRELNFWLEDLYTPGYDSLLKKKEAELRRKKICKILSSVILLVCVIVIIITVPILITQSKD